MSTYKYTPKYTSKNKHKDKHKSKYKYESRDEDKKVLKKIKKLGRSIERIKIEQKVIVENKQKNIQACPPVPKVKDFVIFGRITNCETGDPVVGAIVKAFKCCDGQEVPLSHSFSGCNGRYLLNIPRNLVEPCEKILIMASCTDKPPIPCECDPDCQCP